MGRCGYFYKDRSGNQYYREDRKEFIGWRKGRMLHVQGWLDGDAFDYQEANDRANPWNHPAIQNSLRINDDLLDQKRKCEAQLGYGHRECDR